MLGLVNISTGSLHGLLYHDGLVVLKRAKGEGSDRQLWDLKLSINFGRSKLSSSPTFCTIRLDPTITCTGIKQERIFYIQVLV